MTPAQRIAIENLIDMLQRNPIVGNLEDGEIDFFLLSLLEQKRDGWIGKLLSALMDAFAEDQQTGDTAIKLEEAAGILIAWAANIRERQREDAMGIGRRSSHSRTRSSPSVLGRNSSWWANMGRSSWTRL